MGFSLEYAEARCLDCGHTWWSRDPRAVRAVQADATSNDDDDDPNILLDEPESLDFTLLEDEELEGGQVDPYFAQIKEAIDGSSGERRRGGLGLVAGLDGRQIG